MSDMKEPVPERNDVLLVFPPAAILMLMPELGMPQISSWLKSRGWKSRVLDLNVKFLFDWIEKPEIEEMLKQRWSGRSETFKKTYPEYKFSRAYTVAQYDGQIGYAKSYSPVLNPENKTWHIDEIIANSLKPDPLFEKFYREFLAPEVAESGLIGFELMDHYQLPAVLYFSRRIKEDFPGKNIIIGGPWSTASQSAFSSWKKLFDFIDFACLYAGEEPVEGTLQFLKGEREKKNIPGVVWCENGIVRENEIRPLPDIKSAPAPDFTDLPLHLYPWKALPVRNSAGCPWGKCLFCYHCFPRNKYYEKDTARTAEEMKAVADANNFRKLSLADFSVSPQALFGIAKNLIRIKADVKWDALTRADMAYSDKFAKVLATSGCRQLFVGLEIEDAEEIEKLNKGIKTSNFEKMLESCINNGISIGVFLLNYPGLSEEKLKTGLEYCRNLQKKSRGQMYLIVKDFELGRASNTIGHLDAFGIVLDKDVNMDVRSFSLPFKTTIPWKKLYD